VIVLTVYEMDSAWLKYAQTSAFDKKVPIDNVTDLGNDLCGEGSVVSISSSAQYFFETFLLLNSIFFVSYNAWFFTTDIRNYLGLSKSLRHRYDLNGIKCLIIGATDVLLRPVFDVPICLLVVVEVILRHTEFQSTPLTAAVNILRAVSPFCLHMSIIFFLQAIPGIGYLLIYLRRIYWDFIPGAFTIQLFITAFAHFNMTFFGANSQQGCVNEFSDFLTATYTLSLTMINVQDYDQFDVLHQPIMYVGNVLYVCAVGILLCNLIIAMFSDTISKVNERKVLELKLCQLLTCVYVEENFFLLPFHKSIYVKFDTVLSRRRYCYDNVIFSSYVQN